MSRIPGVRDADIDESARTAFRSFEAEDRDPIALYRVLANAPTFLDGIHKTGAAIRYGSALSRELVELVILRIAHLTGSEYEWKHHLPMARSAGLREDRATHVRHWDENTDIYSPNQIAALKIADEIHELDVTDRCFAGLREFFSQRQATEIVVIASHYESVARIIQALGVDLEPEYSGLD